MAKWIKKTDYGDYRDPLQNHKFDGELLFDKKGNFIRVNRYMENIQSQLKYYYGKHLGSKSLWKMLNTIKRIHIVSSKTNQIKEVENKETNAE